ncbi:uncharacterized protein K460DRAFT_42107 [Cucurbitaria berberidis CBS 394.84]|uniref:RRM domain-containing protein n=1 Tax=Cucurbitaria berberidis CBS 394.84 TaxID=1168544 RepID=A0A9P4LF88_9PLEO|nr:uncharacterized protein K460DRAFT_42107 [Cucurbitaria berberidis CBS 394.84]KAF1851824.1 hypothetical protein K460DRAFT_42107 [Cucurbitaria berberidis CBS 394.84]
MPDSPPPLATTPTPDEPATMSAGKASASPTESDKPTAASMQSATVHQEFAPSTGAAIFSTELCTQPLRPAAGPPYPPVIVRGGGDEIKAVVDAAHYWQAKFKWQCLCIFPGQNWHINDLWDATDIHIESASFCQKMLTFIERDTYYAAKQFAEDWARVHSDRLDFVGSESATDPSDPFAIVDKVFTYGETIGFPRTFLWHVAHMMRTNIAEINGAKEAATEANRGQQPVPMEKLIKAALDATATDAEAASAVKSPSTETKVLVKSVPKSPTVETSSLTPAIPPAATPQAPPTELPAAPPTAPPTAPSQSAPRAAPKRMPSHGPSQPSYHTEPMGSNMGGVPLPTMPPPYVPPQNMRGSQATPRSMGWGEYQPLTQGWPENVYRVPTGPYSRHASSTMSNMQSPQFTPVTMGMGQPMMPPPNAIPPYAQGPLMMSAPMAPNQHFDPAMVQQGIMPGQPMQMQVPPMGQAYVHQPHPAAGARGASMGDMTNTIYYSNNMPGQQWDARAPMPRQASNFNNGGMLYDPYNGANPKFNDAPGYNGGKKSGQSGFANQAGRPRKTSNPGNRPGYGQYGMDRPGNITTSGGRYSEHGFKKGRSEDDPVITQNRSSGCHDTWIGPKNETVTELFVGDLPDDVQVHELKQLFEQLAGISPSQVDIKHAHEQHHHHRLHAFISFSSASDAKKALQIRDRKPHLRDGSVAIVVSVPRRFFQKTPNSVRRGSFTSGSYTGPPHPGPVDERDARGVTRLTAHDEESVVTNPHAVIDRPLYSPQDARSDLQKPVRQLDGNDLALSGSPEARKSKPRQSSPTKKVAMKGEISVDAEATVEAAPVESIQGVDTDRPSPVKAAVTKSEVQVAGQPVDIPTKALDPMGADASTLGEPLTMLTDTSQLVGEKAEAAHEASSQPLEHGEATESQNAREVPQTQPIVEQSSFEVTGPVVKLPVKLADVQAVEQPVAEVKEVETEKPKQPIASLLPAQVEDAGSDDDLKNDISFHSAQELQTDPLRVEPEPEHRDESISMNQGTTTIEFSTTKDSPQPEPISPPQAATENMLPQAPQSPSAQPGQEANMLSEAVTSPQDTETSRPLRQNTAATPTQNVVAIPVQDFAPMAAPSAPPAVEALRKSGAQQIQSLSPFAKPSKTQQKKERESRKKQQKKEQAEKEVKTKAEKVTSSIKLNEPMTAEAKTEQPQSSSSASSQPDSQVTTTELDQATIGKAAKAPKAAKGKGKAPMMAVADQEKKAKGEGEGKGKANESQIVKQELLTRAPSPSHHLLGAPDALPPRAIGVGVEGRQVDPPDMVSPGSPVKPIDTQAPSKKKAPIPAVPHLLLPPNRPSTHGKGSLVSATGVSNPSSLTTADNAPTASEQDTSQIKKPRGTSSSASSVTIEHGNDSTSMKYPRTATISEIKSDILSLLAKRRAEIDKAEAAQAEAVQAEAVQAEAVQTDAVQLDTPQEQAPKKKKKKNKKKTKKPADTPVEPNETGKAAELADTAQPAEVASAISVINSDSASGDDGIDEDYDFYDPFSSQMTHIDAIRRGLKNPNSYYAQVNAAMAADKEEAEAKAEADEAKKVRASLYRLFESY